MSSTCALPDERRRHIERGREVAGVAVYIAGAKPALSSGQITVTP
jgi:hypothetical protein